jgi:hypothetical protein
MKVGITGTRNHITDKQILDIAEFFGTLPKDTELHHGDCLGADYYVAQIAKRYCHFKTVCHPPIKPELRAFHESTEIREPNSYLARNRAIVDEVELLMVVPMQMEWQPKGGTWYTHDYAKKKGKRIIMFWPE